MKFVERVVVSTTLEDARWDEYVKKTACCSIYHLSGWKSVIENTFGHKTIYLMSLDASDSCNGIFPLIHMRSWIFGNFFVSLPFFNYGGVCAENSIILDRLLCEAIEFAKKAKVLYIEIRSGKPLDVSLPVKTNKVSMKLNLPENAEHLWQSFKPKLRSQIKRPLKEGMTAKIGNTEEIDPFYHVFSINMRDLGTPVYPKSFFHNIFSYFPESSRICTIYDKYEKPVASGFLLGFRDTLEIPWASSIKQYNSKSPNMLLYWSALKYACENGYKIFDFGRTTLGEGTYKFKQQWGAIPLQLYWYYWLNNNTILPDLTPKNPKYKIAIYIWKRLPIPLTKYFGPKIIRNVP